MKQFVIGNGEFGETYHLAVARACYGKKIKIVILNDDNAEEFISLLGYSYSIETEEPKEKSHLSVTANIIQESYHEGIGETIFKRIKKIAKTEKWKLPDSFGPFISPNPKVLLWVRNRPDWKPERNMSSDALNALITMCQKNGTIPVLVGGSLIGVDCIQNTLGEYWKDEFFTSSNSIAKQLWTINELYEKCNVIATIGMMSGAIDGIPMILNKKMVFYARKSDVCPRMSKVNSVVPNMHWVNISFSQTFESLMADDLLTTQKIIWANKAVNWTP